MAVTLLHLSDIHFNRRHATGWDPDEDLRHELLNSLDRLVKEHGPFDRVLITGDIAFSGQTREYQHLQPWLAEVARRAADGSGGVWMVPGNHDIDRNVVTGSPELRALHHQLRTASEDRLDAELESVLATPGTGALLLAPLSAYNEFARRYDCSIDAAKPWWERELPLGRSYLLNVRGTTSVLVSDESDDENANRLAVPTVAFSPPSAPKRIGMVLAHHPPVWMRQRERIADLLDSRFRLQLFGHRHIFRLRPEAGNLVLHAGAVHPDRTLDWQPHFNVIRLDVVRTADGSTVLRTRVHPQRWHASGSRFGPDADADGNLVRSYDLALEAAPAPVELDIITTGRLADMLLRTPMGSDREQWRALVSALPEPIQHAYRQSPSLRGDMMSLLRIFRLYPHHRPWQQLADAMLSFDPDSRPTREFVEELTRRGLTPDRSAE